MNQYSMWHLASTHSVNRGNPLFHTGQHVMHISRGHSCHHRASIVVAVEPTCYDITIYNLQSFFTFKKLMFIFDVLLTWVCCHTFRFKEKFKIIKKRP